MCLNDTYMIIGLVYQYMGNWHNIKTHISSVAINDVMVDMHTLLPCSCQMLFDIHDNHDT